jgi:hypothetical protein
MGLENHVGPKLQARLRKEAPGFRPKGHRPKCRHCQKELLPRFEMRRVADNPAVVSSSVPVRVTGWGYQGNGRFCSLRCGYECALRMIPV